MKIRIKTLISVLILGIGLISIYIGLRLYPEFLWFESLGFESIWGFVLKSKIQSFSAFFLIAFLFLKLNISIANRICAKGVQTSDDVNFQPPFQFMNVMFKRYMLFRKESALASASSRAHKILINCLVVLIALMLGLVAKNWWQSFYAFFRQVPFNLTDPVFSKDVSFYIFSLPLFSNLQAWASLLLFITLALTGWIYFTKNILAYLFTTTKNSRIKIHIFSLISLFLLVFAFGVQIKMYALLQSPSGSVFGAGYTDVHANLIGYKILLISLVIEAILLVIWGFKSSLKVPAYFLGVIVVLWVVFNNIYPSIIQNFVVTPNEIQKETPYIERNINFTRLAYQLDDVQEVPFPGVKSLSPKDLAENQTTLSNIRLWNREPLKQTFKQLQEIRLYYEFDNVDVDRYIVNNKLRQVMLSARELDTTQLPSQAQTWVNQRLIYTHGYALCMSPVNEVTPEGLPYFFIKDLPPVSQLDFQVIRPEIYFGEKTNQYVIANTNQPEFNYPKGETNEHNHYQGPGGVQLNSFTKRLIFALKFSEQKMLTSSYINKNSRLLFDRSIQLMVKKIAPFLVFDHDPYLVVTNDGRMVWMMDAYTVSNRFPYSKPYKGLINYIRNSVTVTIDTYTGETIFYIKDKTDPIIATYDRIYPDLFRPFSQMPANLKDHIRYPKDFFTIQSAMYQTYHMSDPQVFYNREDLWATPMEMYGEQVKVMEPYYIVTKLPNEKKASFVLMLPFTPANKNNMISWLSANCDLSDYGQLTVFKFPKERTIFGPMQVESRIDQHTEISQKLTLWGQKGSRVIRGNLMVIPIDDALIYAEPIYLQATQSELPELKRVILSYQDRIVMKRTIEEALAELIGQSGTILGDFKTPLPSAPLSAKTINKLLDLLLLEHARFRQMGRTGNWQGFGQSLQNIDNLIENIKQYQDKK